MTDTKRIAQCLCGALTVTTKGDPARVLTCSCIDCRRKSGSAFSVSTYWPEEATHLSGETRQFRRPSQGGRSLEYHFCPTCGVSLYWRADFAPGMIGIGAGNFEDSGFAVPSQAYWTDQRPDWLAHVNDIPALPQQ